MGPNASAGGGTLPWPKPDRPAAELLPSSATPKSRAHARESRKIDDVLIPTADSVIGPDGPTRWRPLMEMAGSLRRAELVLRTTFFARHGGWRGWRTRTEQRGQ